MEFSDFYFVLLKKVPLTKYMIENILERMYIRVIRVIEMSIWLLQFFALLQYLPSHVKEKKVLLLGIFSYTFCRKSLALIIESNLSVILCPDEWRIYEYLRM